MTLRFAYVLGEVRLKEPTARVQSSPDHTIFR
jgi:hypothetical protein